MKRIILSLGLLMAFCSPSFATCLSGATPASTATLKDAAGTPNTFTAPYVDDGSGNCIPSVNTTFWAGVALGAMANYGTSPGAVKVPGVNAFVTNASPNGAHNIANSPTVNLANDQLTATGAAPPASAFYLGANASGATGGQLRGLINCDNHVFKHITTATDTLAVQGVASQTIYVCGATGAGAGTATFFLENTASTNANCSSSNTQIAGLQTVGTASGGGFYSPFWGGLKNTSGNGLCINSTGTGGVDVDIWYTQF